MKEQIREDLKNGKSIENICNEYDLSFKKLMEIMSEPIHKKKELPEYIVMKNRMYSVRNKIDGKWIYYGRFRTLHQATLARDKLIASNWSLRPHEYLGMMHIYSDKGMWKIQKYFSDNEMWKMYFENKEDAIYVRDELVLHDWDMSYLHDILKTIGRDDCGYYYKRRCISK